MSQKRKSWSCLYQIVAKGLFFFLHTSTKVENTQIFLAHSTSVVSFISCGLSVSKHRHKAQGQPSQDFVSIRVKPMLNSGRYGAQLFSSWQMVTKNVWRMATMQLDKKTTVDWQPDMHAVMRLMFFQPLMKGTSKRPHKKRRSLKCTLQCWSVKVWVGLMDGIRKFLYVLIKLAHPGSSRPFSGSDSLSTSMDTFCPQLFCQIHIWWRLSHCCHKDHTSKSFISWHLCSGNNSDWWLTWYYLVGIICWLEDWRCQSCVQLKTQVMISLLSAFHAKIFFLHLLTVTHLVK